MRMGRQVLSFEQALRWTADFAARKARTLAFDRPVPYLARVVLLAAVYFSAAKLALLAAIPPGYATAVWPPSGIALARSEEHTSELQSRRDLVCRLLLEKKKKI